MNKIIGIFVCLILLTIFSLPILEKFKEKPKMINGVLTPEKTTYIVELDATGILKNWYVAGQGDRRGNVSTVIPPQNGNKQLIISEELYLKITSKYNENQNSKFDLATGEPL